MRTFPTHRLVTLGVLAFATWFPSCDAGSDIIRTVVGPPAPAFGSGARVWEGYWYSRYGLGSLVMKSGNGDLFVPDMGMVQTMVMMVSDDLSAAVPPKNPALLQRVFNAGDPRFVFPNDGDPLDFGDERWGPPLDANTSEAAFGWTMLKETQWAKQFHVDSHFGHPQTPNVDGIPGAQQRFAGMVLFVEAVMQATTWMNSPGLFDATDPAGRYVALMAMSDLVMILEQNPLPHSVDNRYRPVIEMMMAPQTADQVAAMFRAAADGLFSALPSPVTIAESSLFIRALSWYTWASQTNLALARIQQRNAADFLNVAVPSSPVETFQVLRGLVEASRALASPTYLTRVRGIFDAVMATFDPSTGLFQGQSVYTTDDIGEIVGALHELLLFGGFDSGPGEIDAILTPFFLEIINRGNLQISAPPMTAQAQYEIDQLGGVETLFRYPPLPFPRQVGGPNGTAPVFGASLAWDVGAGRWIVDSQRFDTAGAMHLANEDFWFHRNEVDGFPLGPGITLVRSIQPTSGSTNATTDVTITGAGFTGASLVELHAKPPTALSNVVVVDDATITATVDPGAPPGVYDVRVTSFQGTNPTSDLKFTVLP